MTKTRKPTKTPADSELWRAKNLEGRRAFLAGPAAAVADDIVDSGGVLAWHCDDCTDALYRMTDAFDFEKYYRRALVELGYDEREDREPFTTMCNLADDVAVRAYLLGVAVGRRLRAPEAR